MYSEIEINNWLKKMWLDYCKMNPQSQAIEELLVKKGEIIINDHIALRTFNHPSMNIKVFQKLIEKLGYKEKEHYEFVEKKLHAVHFEHSNEILPKIFVSELLVEKCSGLIQETVTNLAQSVTPEFTSNIDFMMKGRPWEMSYQVYEKIAKESEYASWLSAHGFRPNHFTVAIHFLKTFNDIRKINSLLQENNFKLNQSGGVIKGSISEFLEQSSTMAGEIPVQFNEGVYNIPGCYYEFAQRYKMPNGKLFHGFVAKSADKIFESTNKN